jgi:UDP-N-acetyl-2-amino-2-deoxyglucuronate dehydrogenase
MGIEAARAGKHVVVEKPMALTLTEADELINTCKKEGVKLFVIKQNRLNSPVKVARQALEEGRFGRLFMGNVTVRWARPQSYYDQDEWHGTWMFDGGVLMNQASHHVDLLQWMLGEVETVKAYTATLNHNIETEDTAVAILRFKNGAMGVIEATTCVFQKNLEGSLIILGDKGSVKIGGFAVNKMETWNFEDYTTDDEIYCSNSTNPPDVYGFGHLEYFQNVIDVLLGRAKPYTDGFEGRKSLELILAIHQSAISGQEVKLPLRKDSDIEELMLRRRGVRA